jgi:magnesium-transporting ATPase (P-type)
MIRIILVNLLFLFFPALLYFSYVYLRQKEKPNEEILSNAPIFWLFAAGVLLMLASIIIFGHWEGGPIGKRYVPPQVKDGVVIPGHVE